MSEKESLLEAQRIENSKATNNIIDRLGDFGKKLTALNDDNDVITRKIAVELLKLNKDQQDIAIANLSSINFNKIDKKFNEEIKNILGEFPVLSDSSTKLKDALGKLIPKAKSSVSYLKDYGSGNTQAGNVYGNDNSSKYGLEPGDI